MQEKNYLLVIKRDNNNYLSVEWNLTKYYERENLYSLSGIDNFTRKVTRSNLLNELLKENLIEPTEKYIGFVIIYKSNGKTRELKEGTIFKDDNYILSEDDLIYFILENISNKSLINEIFNLCNIKDTDKNLEEFKFILKHIDLFQIKGLNAVKIALQRFKNISYDKKRNIIIKISNKVIPKIINKKGKNNLNKYTIIETKVA